jgi:hypothetical protein
MVELKKFSMNCKWETKKKAMPTAIPRVRLMKKETLLSLSHNLQLRWRTKDFFMTGTALPMVSSSGSHGVPAPCVVRFRIKGLLHR